MTVFLMIGVCSVLLVVRGSDVTNHGDNWCKVLPVPALPS